jgi:hypothetical protein
VQFGLTNSYMAYAMALLGELNCYSVKRRHHIHEMLDLITDLIKERIHGLSELENGRGFRYFS